MVLLWEHSNGSSVQSLFFKVRAVPPGSCCAADIPGIGVWEMDQGILSKAPHCAEVTGQMSHVGVFKQPPLLF